MAGAGTVMPHFSNAEYEVFLAERPIGFPSSHELFMNENAAQIVELQRLGLDIDVFAVHVSALVEFAAGQPIDAGVLANYLCRSRADRLRSRGRQLRPDL